MLVQSIQMLVPRALNQSGVAKAAFTTRLGGVSSGPWMGLNLGLHVGDKREDVIANRELTACEWGVSLDQWVCGEQVHGNRVAVVKQDDRGRGARAHEDAIKGVDALVTDVRGVVLATFAADCVPILLLDPVQKAVAVIHAGWKGTMQQIAKETVRTMQEAYGSRPEHLLAAIGPAIDDCCYEVDQHVFIPFVDVYPKGQDFFHKNASDKWQLTIPDANAEILQESGLLPEHISREGGCTSCNTRLFFSHRAEKGKTGRHAGLIMLV